MRSRLFVFLLLATSGCINAAINEKFEELTRQMTQQDAEVVVLVPEQLATVRRIAVVKFRDLSWKAGAVMEVFPDNSYVKGKVFPTHDGCKELLAERFEEILLRERVVEVVERSRLASVMGEQALAQSGVTHAALPEVLAAGAGAEAVLLGTLTMGMVYVSDNPEVSSMGTFAVHVRLIDARNGRILAFGRDMVSVVQPLVNDEAIISEISTRLAVKLSQAIADAREQHPDAQAPERADFMR